MSEERTRSYSWQDPMPYIKKGMSLAGIDYIQMLLNGNMPAIPIAETLAYTLEEAEVGRAIFSCEPKEFHLNPLGIVHGGLASTLLDSAMACAVHTTLPQGVGYTTLQLNINLTRAIRTDSGKLYCEGKVIHAGKQMATAEGTLRDANGKIYAHGTTTCLVFSLDGK